MNNCILPELALSSRLYPPLLHSPPFRGFNVAIMGQLRNATLVLLVRRTGNGVSEICLAMKKRGFGMNRWNGVGGKVDEPSETIEEAAKREAREEIGVSVEKLDKVAELSFSFPHNPKFDQMVHVYFCDSWDGEPTESDEMRPKWFSVDEIPYSQMWPADIYWLPGVLKGSLVKAKITFGEGDTVRAKKISVVESL